MQKPNFMEVNREAKSPLPSPSPYVEFRIKIKVGKTLRKEDAIQSKIERSLKLVFIERIAPRRFLT
jgi:hypothetical protein